MSTAAGKVKRSSSGGVVGLQGPRPQPLTLPAAASPPPRPSKRPRVNGDGDVVGAPPAAPPGPVIVYEHTPRVIHARPDEFKALVQRLTGRQQPDQPAASPEEEAAAGADDPLVLTLGKQASPPPLLVDYHTPPTLALPSPGGGLAGFLLSPGSFLFSPATMQALHELISS